MTKPSLCHIVDSGTNSAAHEAMAKKHRSEYISVAFHYLIKDKQDPENRGERLIQGFTREDFDNILRRIRNIQPLNENDEGVVARIKSGQDLPFSEYNEIEPGLHFGSFDAAYYGQQYRNNRHGVITADSLNLRKFYYLLTMLNDGRILIGVTYNGQFGDYEGFRRCMGHLLKGRHVTRSRTITSIRSTLGRGTPTEIKLYYRKAADRDERRPLFSSTGVIAIRATDYGDGFDEQVRNLAAQAVGDTRQKKRAIAALASQGDTIELDEDDIVGCQAIVREHGLTRTVYFIGENDFSTRFPLAVDIDLASGLPNGQQVRDEIRRVLRGEVMPLLA